jgi:hypothetical protein
MTRLIKMSPLAYPPLGPAHHPDVGKPCTKRINRTPAVAAPPSVIGGPGRDFTCAAGERSPAVARRKTFYRKTFHSQKN